MSVDYTLIIWAVGLIALMWFFMIGPQRKREKERQSMLQSLSVDDRVVTIGGIYGYVDQINEETVHLEIAEDVVIIVLRNSIAMIKNENSEEENDSVSLAKDEKK